MAWTTPPPAPGQPPNWGAHLNVSLNELEARQTDTEDRVSVLESAPGGGGSASIPGVVQLADFAGSTWDQRLTAALSYAAAQTRIPYIMFPSGDISLNQGGRTPFTGMKLVGPGFAPGSKNLEIASGKNVSHRVSLGSGITTGTNSLFHATENVYAVYVGGLAFSNNRTAQFWSQPSGTLYASQFDSLTFFGMKAVFGNVSQKALWTQVNCTGHWQVQGHSGGDTQFHLGGSDNSLWMAGYLNIDGSAGTGAYQMYLDGMEQTRVGFIYFTSQDGWRSVRVAPGSRDLEFFGLISEGRNASTPCHGNLMSIEGGSVKIHGLWTAYGMTAPSTQGGGNNGIVQVSGGAHVLISGASYKRATGVAESVPWLYATGSGTKVTVLGVTGETPPSWTGKPRYQTASGATVIDLDQSLQAA